jgi:steroid delta-isomerase
MTADAKTTRATIENYVKAWATGDKKLFLSIFADDAVWEDPVGAPPFKGLKGVEKFWDFSHQGPERQLTPAVHEIVTCANQGILRFTMQVRLPKENQGLDLSIIDYFEVNDAGKITVAKAFWDETKVAVPAGMQIFMPNISEAYS